MKQTIFHPGSISLMLFSKIRNFKIAQNLLGFHSRSRFSLHRVARPGFARCEQIKGRNWVANCNCHLLCRTGSPRCSGLAFPPPGAKFGPAAFQLLQRPRGIPAQVPAIIFNAPTYPASPRGRNKTEGMSGVEAGADLRGAL